MMGTMSFVDAIIFLAIIAGAVIGYMRGIIKQISSIAALVLGILVCNIFGGWAAEVLRVVVPSSAKWPAADVTTAAFAEILLFVLVGAQFNFQAAVQAGIAGLAIIAVGLVGRCLGVALALLRSELNRRERLFCVFAYLPKATVQAAVGAVPLAAGVASGSTILAVAVLAIVITAPLGALLIRFTASRLLIKEQ